MVSDFTSCSVSFASSDLMAERRLTTEMGMASLARTPSFGINKLRCAAKDADHSEVSLTGHKRLPYVKTTPGFTAISRAVNVFCGDPNMGPFAGVGALAPF